MKNGTHVSKMTLDELLDFVENGGDPHGKAREEIVNRVNNADELADALEDMVRTIEKINSGKIKSTLWVADFPTSTSPDTKSVFEAARAALAAYRGKK